MRWLWFVLSVACFAVAFRTHSMGLAALTLLGALGFLVMGTLALVSSRIESGGRSAVTLLGTEEARRLRAQIEQRKREGGDATPAVAAGGGMQSTAAAGRKRADGDVGDGDSGSSDGGGDGGGGD
jgi:hypothetical protein